MFVRTKGELRREKQEGAARNPSETTTSDKQSAHFTQCCCRRGMFLCFCLTFSALHCNAPSLSAPFLCSSCRCPPPSLPPSPFLPNPLKITFSFRIKFNIWRRKKSPKLLLFSASEQISDGLRHDSGQLRWFVLNRVDFFAAATHYWLLLHPSVLFNLFFFLHLYSLNCSTSNLQCVKFLNKTHSSHTKRLCHLIKTFSSTLPWQIPLNKNWKEMTWQHEIFNDTA